MMLRGIWHSVWIAVFALGIFSGCTSEKTSPVNAEFAKNLPMVPRGSLAKSWQEENLKQLAKGLALGLKSENTNAILKQALDRAPKHGLSLSELVQKRVQSGKSILSIIASELGLDPGTVSAWMSSLEGLEATMPAHLSQWDGDAMGNL